MRDFVSEMFGAIDSGSWHRLGEFFDSEVVYIRPGYPPIRGLADLVDFYANRRVIRSGTHVIEQVVADDSGAVAIGEVDASLRDGRPVHVRFADAYRFRDGRIVHRHTFFDVPAV